MEEPTRVSAALRAIAGKGNTTGNDDTADWCIACASRGNKGDTHWGMVRGSGGDEGNTQGEITHASGGNDGSTHLGIAPGLDGNEENVDKGPTGLLTVDKGWKGWGATGTTHGSNGKVVDGIAYTPSGGDGCTGKGTVGTSDVTNDADAPPVVEAGGCKRNL